MRSCVRVCACVCVCICAYHTYIRYEQIELLAQLVDYFLWSNKSNINQMCGSVCMCARLRVHTSVVRVRMCLRVGVRTRAACASVFA